MTDEAGNEVWSIVYSAFGEVVRIEGSVTSNLRFAGQYYDAETGFHCNWNRYYIPETGRYLTQDPIGIGGGESNLYAYSLNNPHIFIDPYGLWNWMRVGRGAIKAATGVVVGVAVGAATVLTLPAAVISSPIIAAAGTVLAVTGAFYLGWKTGQVISGKKIGFKNGRFKVTAMCEEERSELLGQVLV